MELEREATTRAEMTKLRSEMAKWRGLLETELLTPNGDQHRLPTILLTLKNLQKELEHLEKVELMLLPSPGDAGVIEGLKSLRLEQRQTRAELAVVQRKLRSTERSTRSASDVGEHLMSSSEWKTDNTEQVLQLLGDSCANVQETAQKLLEKLGHPCSWEQLAVNESQERNKEPRKRKRGVEDTEAAQQQGEQAALLAQAAPSEASATKKHESTVQLGMMFLLRKLQEVVPIVCWHVFDTSVSGLAGRQGPIDISFTAAPLRSWCQLLFYSELKPQLQPESAQHAVVGQLSDRSVDMFEHQPPQRSHVFSMAGGEDAAQLVCMRKHNTPLHTRMEPFSFKEDSPGLLLWLRLLLAKKDVHGFVQTQPPIVAVPGAQLSNFDLVDWRGGGNEEDWGAGTSSRSDTAAACATSTIRSSQVWRASCRRGSEAPQDVAVKTGSRALIQHEAEMMVRMAGVAGVVQLVHSNSAQPSELGDQRLRLPKDFNEVPFLVSAPFGRCLQFDDTAATILGAVGGIARTIGELGKLKPPVLHRDVSIGNIMIVEDGLVETGGCSGAYLIDLATACLAEGGQYQGDSTELTGTPLFIARSVLEGRPHTQSSDLESLLLVLIYPGCEGHVHWANCEIGTRVATALKGYSLLPELFDKYVAQRCQSDLLPAIRRLHQLFYNPYNTLVTAEQFLGALCAPVAAE